MGKPRSLGESVGKDAGNSLLQLFWLETENLPESATAELPLGKNRGGFLVTATSLLSLTLLHASGEYDNAKQKPDQLPKGPNQITFHV